MLQAFVKLPPTRMIASHSDAIRIHDPQLDHAARILVMPGPWATVFGAAVSCERCDSTPPWQHAPNSAASLFRRRYYYASRATLDDACDSADRYDLGAKLGVEVVHGRAVHLDVQSCVPTGHAVTAGLRNRQILIGSKFTRDARGGSKRAYVAVTSGPRLHSVRALGTLKTVAH